jgi:hypothetical protein
MGSRFRKFDADHAQQVSQTLNRPGFAGSQSGAPADRKPRRCAAWPITDPNVTEPGEQTFVHMRMPMRGARSSEVPSQACQRSNLLSSKELDHARWRRTWRMRQTLTALYHAYR